MGACGGAAALIGPERDNPLDAVLRKLCDAAELNLSMRAPRVAEWRKDDTPTEGRWSKAGIDLRSQPSASTGGQQCGTPMGTEAR